jgi:tRNA nucleotidyltransferase/poly(A) polymerase
MAKIYKVGGCVRDAILGLESKDIDFVFVSDNIRQSVDDGFAEMYKWLSDSGFVIFLSTPEMFTIRAKFPSNDINAGLVADFVLARKEIGYVDFTRRPILELGSLEDDLIRRDFTLNSLAVGDDEEIIDLFGGMDDLQARILRTPLPAKQTMMDDPLRVLRTIRFKITKGFEIHADIYEAMKQPDILDKLKLTVSGERVREELLKMMKHDTTETIRLIHWMDTNIIPGFLDLVFKDRGMWLKPTFEKK